MPNRSLPELISAQQSNQWVLIIALLIAAVGAFWGYRRGGWRGVLLGTCGPLLWVLWQGHQWMTRYDPQSGYFGLNKLWVLALELIVFIGLGLALGRAWNWITKSEQ